MPRRVSPTPAAVSSFNLRMGSSSCSLRQRGVVMRGGGGAAGCLTGEGHSYDEQHAGWVAGSGSLLPAHTVPALEPSVMNVFLL